MQKATPPPRDIVLPAASLPLLRRALRAEVGTLTATHALHSAGWEVGQAVYEAFSRGLDQPPERLATGAFWARLATFLHRRGWGALRHARPHPGVGTLTSDDWAEAGESSSESQPSCPFSSGLLAGFLTRSAGSSVAVLHVECRARGDDACVFAYGAESTVHTLYGLLLDGRDFTAALSEL